MQETPSPKVYVKVDVGFDENGRMLPRSLGVGGRHYIPD
jgi:hypothetical protein